MFEIEDVKNQVAKIKVVGVGGAGGNAINNMITSNLRGVEFIAINTDTQVLETSLASVKLQIGASVTRGLGAGSNPQVGKQSAEDDRAAIAEALEGADMVFITAGMGGGTGTGASPVVAGIARELGALTVVIVTRPFFYEGRTRAVNADEGIRELRESVDTLIVIPNDRITAVVEKKIPIHKGFAVTDDVLRQAVKGISDIILVPGLINVDFADVKTVMTNTGRAVMGIGVGYGEGGAIEAARKAISNPLLEDSSIEGAKGILFNITGGINLSLSDMEDAASLIYDSAHEKATIIIGNVIDPNIDDEVRVTVIATGFNEAKEKLELPQIRKWAPAKGSLVLKGSERILSKNIRAGIALDSVSSDLLPYEDTLDVPTFLRRMPQRNI